MLLSDTDNLLSYISSYIGQFKTERAISGDNTYTYVLHFPVSGCTWVLGIILLHMYYIFLAVSGCTWVCHDRFFSIIYFLYLIQTIFYQFGIICSQLQLLSNLDNLVSKKEKVWSMTKLLSVPTSVSDLDNLCIWSQDQSHSFWTFSCFLQSCSFIFDSVVWYLPIKADWVYYGLRPWRCQPRWEGAGGGVGVWWVFDSTFENPQWGEVKQMQSMQLCIFSRSRSEDTLKNAQRRKVKKMLPM